MLLVMARTYYVYIAASRSRRLYIGVTGNIHRRMAQHRGALDGGSVFARHYRMERLVHAEEFDRALEAIEREKQLKGWRRVRKLALISASNPAWDDLLPPEYASTGRPRSQMSA